MTTTPDTFSVSLKVTVIVLVLAVSAVGQSLLNAPESAVYDAARNRYLVSNYANGQIIAIDEYGDNSVFANGKASSAGLLIVEDTLYIGCGGQGLLAYNLETAEVVMDLTIPGSVLLNDVEADTSGHIFVSDPYGNKIYRVDLSDRSYTTLLDPIAWPNGLVFDPVTNRLLACGSTTRFVFSIDTEDGSYYALANLGDGHLDGLAFDRYGNLYVSSQGPNAVLRYDELPSSQPPKPFSKGHPVPADIFFNSIDDILVVPNIGGNTVEFIDLGRPDLFLVCRPSTEIVGNHNGAANPGETLELEVAVFNYGQDCLNLTGELRCDDPMVTVVDGTASFDTEIPYIEAGGTQTPYTVSVDQSCPDPHYARLEIDFYRDDVYATTDSCYLLIGDTRGFHDDAESGAVGWLHRSITIPYTDQWHLEDYRAYAGDWSWKVGGDGAGVYADHLDAVLISPPVRLPPDATLSFRHWIDAENATSLAAYDGAVVAIMTDYDPSWTQIAPVGGYSHRVIANVESPFSSGTDCFSGTDDWSLEEFDLGPYTGVVQFMFRFGSDGSDADEGWYIDDVSVAGQLCCDGRVGDANGVGGDEPTIGDISAMIDMLFLTKAEVACRAEADINQSGGSYPVSTDITIGDISALIDYLFITGSSLGLPACL